MDVTVGLCLKKYMYYIMKKILAVAVGIVVSASGVLASNAGKRIAALDNALWACSEWISAADAPVVEGRIDDFTRAADGASWFVADVKNDRKVKRACWMTAGLGVYDLYVNGKIIGEEVLKPGFTHYGKTKRSFTYDVTDAMDVNPGASNRFSVQVTPGWWGDKIITPHGNEGMIGRKTAFRGVIELTFDDGTKACLGSNVDDWKGGIAGPVKHAAIFDGEVYDAREQPGYLVADRLSKPEKNTEFKGEILPSEGAEVYHRDDLAMGFTKAYIWNGVTGNSGDAFGKVVVVREFKPGQKMALKPGETLVVDFGQNSSAVPEFEFAAEEGTTLRCYPAELLNDGNGAKSRGMDGPEGSTHRLNLRTPDTAFRLDYTFADNGGRYVTFRPRATFFGYRYMSVTADGDVSIKSVKSVPVTSIAKNLETGKLTTGNEMINRLISNTVWGQISNYLSVPTDCPQRNERLGWMADTQVFAETGSFFADTADFFHKWLRDVRDTQNEAGGYPGVAPMAQYGCMPTDMSRLGWADAGIIVPWVVWKQFADTKVVDDSWESMERFMDHINATKYNHRALDAENGNFQWADWLSYEPLESCGGLHVKREGGREFLDPDAEDYWNYLSACYWLSNAEMMRDMAMATGRDADKYVHMASEARSYLQGQFLNADGSFRTAILNTMQTPALFALRGGLVDGEARDNMISRLRKNFADHGNCLQTGFLGTSILMPVLTENGMSDIAYELLFQRNNPSWLYSIDNGATTIWERWNSYMLDTGMGPRGMNSFNHYAYGCVCEWMWETMAGISSDVSAPGFKRIVMKPVPDRRLGFVKAEFNSPVGLIKSHWRYSGDRWIWEFTVPDGAVAEVTIPGETTSKEYDAGTHKVVCRGV